MNDENFLSLRSVQAGYGAGTVLQDISLEIKTGEILALVGPNGCGKSTLLKAAARQLMPRQGEIYLKGRPIGAYPPKELARTLAVLPQSQRIPAISVERLVLHGRFPYLGFSRRPSGADLEKVEEALEMTGMADKRKKELHALSGGERQKAFFAMVLAQDTELIFLDEPTTYLDIRRQFEILELICQINRRGKTILMVLHDLSHVLSNSHRVALMEGGRLVAVDRPEHLYQSGALERAFGVRGHYAQQDHVYYFTL